TKHSVVTQFNVYCLDSEYKTFGRVEIKVDHGQGYHDFIKFKTLTDQMDKYLPNDSYVLGTAIITKISAIVDSLSKKKEEFFASKAVLSSQSEVFQQMFTDDMKEKKTSEVIIDDIEPEVFKEFLKLIYFGT
ncbi:unnamed protein product, partial [Oppiella nova]